MSDIIQSTGFSKDAIRVITAKLLKDNKIRKTQVGHNYHYQAIE